MCWDEFRALLSGLSAETALGRVVVIRAETDKDVIRRFSPDQKRIYNNWRNRKAESVTAQDYDKQMKHLEQMMASLCG